MNILMMAFCATFAIMTLSASPAPAACPVQTLDMEVRAGQEFSIEMPANHTTGYQWKLAEPVDDSLLTQLGTEYQNKSASPPRMGAGGLEIWSFKALKPGRAELKFVYIRPWEKEAEPARATTITMIIR